MVPENVTVDKPLQIYGNQNRSASHVQYIPTSGSDFALSGISILRLEEGQFAELRVEQDMLGLMAKPRAA
jgi:hypothetical protein